MRSYLVLLLCRYLRAAASVRADEELTLALASMAYGSGLRFCEAGKIGSGRRLAQSTTRVVSLQVVREQVTLAVLVYLCISQGCTTRSRAYSALNAVHPVAYPGRTQVGLHCSG
ncbi:hypothetical protein F5X98DRAFT_100005 [Xylaria grammica]|nr:hypothetical protein F5X98DRAFT_100005 [Xylaria grammica]